MQTVPPDVVTIARREKVAVVAIDNPPVNALSLPVRQGLLNAFASLEKDAVAAVVVISARADFIAGADLREMALPPVDPSLPDVIRVMENCPHPIVAAISGGALGGGYEFALACDLRIAAPDAVVGLPETRLGIIPGAGGTQRLPRLVGVAKAIELIAEGRRVSAKQALELGMIDRIVEGDLLAAAIEIAGGARKRRLSRSAVPQADAQSVEDASGKALKRAKNAPHIRAAIELIRESESVPFDEAVLRERTTFLRLRESDEAKALRHLFFAEREVRKVPGLEAAKPRPIERIAVIGAGTMGAGIAVAGADAGLAVEVVERDTAAVGAGYDRIAALYERQTRRQRIAAATAEERMSRITVSDDWNRISAADLVIEAVFEDMAVKQETFRRIDALARPGALLASNTSYLDIDAIAAATGRPGEVLGLHFFSPANVMRLLEVVRGAKSSPESLATALAFARRIGKLPVVAGNCDGFIGNRIFACYRRHAEYLALDGAPIETIDRAVENFGFAMGPFAVSDLAGLDIAWAMRKRRAATRPADERYVEVADRLCEQGRFGRKTGRGWYRYDADGKRSPDPEVAALFDAERAAKKISPRRFSDDEIVRRLLAAMANEGAKVLADGIALRASDIDLVFVNGYGFPATKGGPMFVADTRGLARVLEDVRASAGGVGSEPAPLLIELAARNARFADRAGRQGD